MALTAALDESEAFTAGQVLQIVLDIVEGKAPDLGDPPGDNGTKEHDTAEQGERTRETDSRVELAESEGGKEGTALAAGGRNTVAHTSDTRREDLGWKVHALGPI
jgi:hypothetical protein